MEEVRLTQFSPGAGCGCKISPRDLEEILKNNHIDQAENPFLLVGNSTKDDAAVYDIGDGRAVVSTTDFFTPIVDDPYDFGRIASVNAISDIYAMGGKPMMAIAILAWPLEKLSKEHAHQVIEGARAVCKEAGITLAGGHSIDISEPVFGLAVTGMVPVENVKKNSAAKAGSKLFLTKPLGIGIVTTAEKRGVVEEADKQQAVRLMTSLNKIGEDLGSDPAVNAITDVTGFGLMGHLIEICEGSKVNAEVHFDKVPLIDNLQKYVDLKTFPGGTFRNYKSYGAKAHSVTDQQKHILCDPQTSGGLLVSVDSDKVEEVKAKMQSMGHDFYEIGELKPFDDTEKLVKVV
jgi:selenide,water dikinase